MTMKNNDYMITIQSIVNGSNLTDEEKKQLLEYTEYLINYEQDHNLGKAYGYLKKQYTAQQIEINQLKREIEEMKNVF